MVIHLRQDMQLVQTASLNELGNLRFLSTAVIYTCCPLVDVCSDDNALERRCQ